MHYPIYPNKGTSPTNGDNIEYRLEKVEASNGVSEVNLIVKSYAIDTGTGLLNTTPDRQYNQTWVAPVSTPLVHIEPNQEHVGNDATDAGPERYIKYIFEVKHNGNTYPETDSSNMDNYVGFAIRPYYLSPETNPQNANAKPAPVYIRQNVNPGLAMNTVFIPDDSSITSANDLSIFRGNCYWMILSGLLEELFDHNIHDRQPPYANSCLTQSLIKYFNFYINPVPGTVHTAPLAHRDPDNNSHISTFDAWAFLHNIVHPSHMDHAYSNKFSSPQANQDIMHHECGHILFGLAEEYCRFTGNLQENILPNNWAQNPGTAQERAREKKSKSHHVCNSPKWHIVCAKNKCRMSSSLYYVYDIPCRHRVCFHVNHNAGIDNFTAMGTCCPENDLILLDVTPFNPTVPVGNTEQFTAIGEYADASHMDITDSVSWSSSNTTIADIDPDGLATGISPGVVNITAVKSGITKTSPLTVP
jgi:hypothetical protein